MRSTEASLRYRGEKASLYDARREKKEKWILESQALESILSALPPGLSVLDIPVGTGRFIPLYHQLGVRATGIDSSSDMLAVARDKAGQLGASIECLEGDVRKLSMPDDTFDAVISVRLLNLLRPDDLRPALDEMARVSRRFIILSVTLFVPLQEIELTSPQGLRSVIGQFHRRVKARINWRRWRAHAHEHHLFMALIRELNLTLTRTIPVSRCRDETRYSIYVLEKQSS
jgi:ubiquinone/menaquinone biosynthesis C-methylase UbiE